MDRGRVVLTSRDMLWLNAANGTLTVAENVSTPMSGRPSVVPPHGQDSGINGAVRALCRPPLLSG